MVVEEIVSSAQTLMDVVTKQVVTPLLILFLGIIISRLVRNAVEKFGASIDLDATTKKLFGQEAPYTELLAGGVAAIIITVAVIWSLYIAGVLQEAVQLVAVVFLIIIFLGAILFLRDIIPNSIARTRVQHRHQRGDDITIQGITGKITRFHFLSVEVLSEFGNVYVPYRCFPREAQA